MGGASWYLKLKAKSIELLKEKLKDSGVYAVTPYSFYLDEEPMGKEIPVGKLKKADVLTVKIEDFRGFRLETKLGHSDSKIQKLVNTLIKTIGDK